MGLTDKLTGESKKTEDKINKENNSSNPSAGNNGGNNGGSGSNNGSQPGGGKNGGGADSVPKSDPFALTPTLLKNINNMEKGKFDKSYVKVDKSVKMLLLMI